MPFIQPKGTQMTNPPAIDLLSAASFANRQPHEQFRWLRHNAPVYWHPEPHGRGFWAVTRYYDVRAVRRDPKIYSSFAGGIQIGDADERSLAGLRNMMLMIDPPQHTRYRQLVSRQFTPHRVQALRPRIEELAIRIIDRVSEGRTASVCQAWSKRSGNTTFRWS